jgi:hypothetical protein
MEPDFERRLIRSMSGCSSLSSSPFSSPLSSPSPIKHSDRFIPLRSLSQTSAFFIDQEQLFKGPMLDKKSTRDGVSTNTTGNVSTTNGTTIAADRTKDILTYQALLQNEMFGTQIDTLYDEQHMNSGFANGNSNHQHSTGSSNPTATLDATTNTGINVPTSSTTVHGQTSGPQNHNTVISGISVSERQYDRYLSEERVVWIVSGYSHSILSTTPRLFE